MRQRRWNANLHYNSRLLAAVPPEATSVLDVGCGEGDLSVALAERGLRTVGLDADGPVLARARAHFRHAPVSWVQGDVLTYPFLPDSFDAVVSNATLHHLPDDEIALKRFAEIARPGGTVAVVGFARNDWWDWPRALVGQFVLILANLVRRKWEHTAPQSWPPRLTYSQIRRAATRTLPGLRWRRLLYGRFLLTWRKPGVQHADTVLPQAG